MLKKLTFIFSFFGALFLQPVVGQVPHTITVQTGGGPVNYTIQSNHYQPSNFNNSRRSGLNADLNSYNYYSIAFLNDSLISVNTRINTKHWPHKIQVKQKRKKVIIYPNQTQFIAKLLGNQKVAIGIAADSCWIFKTHIGSINAYSYLPAIDTWEYVVAIQKGEKGPIVQFTVQNFEAMIRDNPTALEFLKIRDYQSALEEYNKESIQATEDKDR